jgi:4-hydroxy-3-methylbut-2-enyl diphosphate reductase
MQISRARYAGACYGVKRALRLVDDFFFNDTATTEIYTLGPLIHNPQVVENLQAKGVRTIDSPDQAKHGTVVIRSHGVSPHIIEQLKLRGLQIVDATCPHVTKAQKAASDLARAGYTVVVVGQAGHPEVEGISAYAGQPVHIVQSPDELPIFAANALVGVVAQTTQTAEALAAVVRGIEAQGIIPTVHDTVCFATRQRQESASELAARVDVMLVVGGRNSSNTTRLAELCTAVCARTFHIEQASEIDAEWFTEAQSVGIAAGASTPEEQLVSVEKFLAQLLGS